MKITSNVPSSTIKFIIMKTKHILFTIMGCLLLAISFSFTDPVISSRDFKGLIGCWSGSLTYLDYTSNKPFSMPVTITVKDFSNSNLVICSLEYPKEPAANALDTIFISKDGRLLNNETVKTKRVFGKDSLEIVTEITGVDGNDNKPAILRHTYLLGRNNYSIRKEVHFAGQNDWILRNEYKLVRAKACK